MGFEEPIAIGLAVLARQTCNRHTNLNCFLDEILVNRHKPRPRHFNHGPKERSVGRLLITFSGLIIVTGGCIVAWLFLADRDILFNTPQQASAGNVAPVLARYKFDTAELVAPTRLVTRVKKRTLGNVTKLDLLLPWPYTPGTIPKLPATASEFNDWVILTFQTGNTDELTPVERYGEIYPVYFDGEPKPVTGNLLKYAFKEGSPYSDLTLYVANADGKQVIHRCDKKPSVLGPILCERTIALNDSMQLSIRFALDHLEDWADIEKNVHLALANMFRSTP
jgi:hypothetical protein